MKRKFKPTFLPLLEVPPTSPLPTPPIHHPSWLVLVVNSIGRREMGSDWSPTYLQNFQNKTPAIPWGDHRMNVFKEQSGDTCFYFLLLPASNAVQADRWPKKQKKKTNQNKPKQNTCWWLLKENTLEADIHTHGWIPVFHLIFKFITNTYKTFERQFADILCNCSSAYSVS